MSEQNFLAFDLGAESGRAVLGKLNDGKLTLDEKHRFANPNGRMNGHLHWNLLQQWEELKTGLRKAGTKLDGIGVDTWGVDFGLIGKGGEILGNPYMYRDSRTDGMMDAVFKIVPKNEVFEQTGIQFMQLNSLFQIFAMAQAKSVSLANAETLLFMPDLFNYLFTGVRKAEFSITTTSQMYDPCKKRWATEMLEKLGIPTKLLPEIIPSGTVISQLSREVADECKVDAMPVIAPACHDTGSAVAAVPAEGDGWCYISSGTWSLMGVELTEPVINEKSLKYNYTNEGGVGGTIRFLKNIMGLWLVQECRRQFVKDGYDHSYAELTQMAERASAFGALIDPDHGPFLSPGEMPAKIEAFCRATKQRPPVDRGQFIRTCLESLALTYRRTLEGLEDILGKKITTIHIVGGGCNNLLLNQMTADACGRTVITGPVEGTAIGNILVQAMAVGKVKSLNEARTIVRNSFDVKIYKPRDSSKWESAYSRFREIVGKE
ncbi:MAG TPA: rhamnulokinase family protein [Tepidisphaeraceae bacterium]|nr:rhamnulokinase family protein [Tepidisphaeraceae bacterium]